MQIDLIYSVCLKKIMTPLLDQPESSNPPLSISNFFMIPPTFLPPRPLEINNDRSLMYNRCTFFILQNRGKYASIALFCIVPNANDLI